MNNDLRQQALAVEASLRQAYSRHEEHRPVLLFDVQELRIYAYPYADFKATLSDRSRALLQEEYETATAQNQMVVFVRDRATRRLLSFPLARTS